MGFAPVFARRLIGSAVTDDGAQRVTSILLSAQGVGAVIGGLMVTTVTVRFGRSVTTPPTNTASASVHSDQSVAVMFDIE